MPSLVMLIVAVFLGLVVYFGLELLRQWLRKPKTPTTLAGVRNWLENFFGTRRREDYCPPGQEEARQILRFLDDFQGEAVMLLRREAYDAFDDDKLPSVIADSGEERNLRLDAIEEVCRQWLQKQNTKKSVA